MIRMRDVALLVAVILAGLWWLTISFGDSEDPDPARRALLRSESQLMWLKQALSDFAFDTCAIPAQLNELVESDVRGWNGPYVKARDLVDPWGGSIKYQVSCASETEIELTTLRADRAPGGTEDNADLSIRHRIKFSLACAPTAVGADCNADEEAARNES